MHDARTPEAGRGQHATAGARILASDRRSAILAWLVAAAVLLPFLGKAFTIDDTFFLFSARHALSDPLHPTAFEINWERVPERASRIAPTGPVMAWLLVPAVLAGGAEWVAHLVTLVALLAAAWATVALSSRLMPASPWARSSGLLLVAMPAVLGMSGTAMPDMPAMALGVLGVERLVAWRDEGRVRDAILSSVLLSLAALTRTHLVGLAGVGALLLAGDPFTRSAWTRPPWTRWLPAAAAPVLAAVVSAVTRDPDPAAGTILQAAFRYASVSHFASNFVAFSVHWVLAIAFALPWLALRWRAVLRAPWALIAGTAAAAVLLRVAREDAAPDATRLVFAPIAGLGLAALADVFVDALRRRDGVQLALGTWLLVSVPALSYTHFPAKYLVASAPAAALLVVRAVASHAHARALLAATTAAGVLLGVAILRADAVMAGVGRDAARTLIAPNVAAGRRVWYLGHWGFQWYAERAGGRSFAPERPEHYPAWGDLIASDDNLANPVARVDLEQFTHVGRVEAAQPGGRIMSAEAGAGFYSNSWGYLPWGWGTGAADAVDLWLAYPSADAGRAPPPSRP